MQVIWIISKTPAVVGINFYKWGNYALSHGMKTLRQDGLLKALKGITTVEEVVKNTIQ